MVKYEKNILGGDEMLAICSMNSMINRLPMALCGIQHVLFRITLPVCLKLNDEQK